jgi:uncharacterized protein (TIGR02996 family)
MNASSILLEDILANPSDDVPRLIYADWLDDHGGPSEQARAELIRLQITLASLRSGDERRPEFEAQERRLRKRHERQWLGDLREHVHAWQFARGFVVHLALDASALLRCHDEIARTHPIHSLRLTNARERGILASLAEKPLLARLRALDLSNNCLGRADVEAMLNSPHLAHLEELRFNDNPYGYDAILAVVESRELAQLRTLEMRRNNLTETTAVRLADSPALAGLTAVDLRGNAIGEAGRHELGRFFPAVVRY